MDKEPSILKDLIRTFGKAIKGEVLSEQELAWGNICASMVRGFVNIRWKCEKDQPLEEYEKALRNKIPENVRSLIMTLYQNEITSDNKPYDDGVVGIYELISVGFANDFCNRIDGVKTEAESLKGKFTLPVIQPENMTFGLSAGLKV